LFMAAPVGNTLPTRAELERTCRGSAAQGAAPP